MNFKLESVNATTIASSVQRGLLRAEDVIRKHLDQISVSNPSGLVPPSR